MVNDAKFLKAVRKLNEAFSEMSTAWYGIVDSELGVADYPFAESFDELANKVTVWRETCEKKADGMGDVLKLGKEMIEIPIEPRIIGYIDLGRENVLRMKAYVDASLTAPFIEELPMRKQLFITIDLEDTADEALSWLYDTIALENTIRDRLEEASTVTVHEITISENAFSIEDYMKERIIEKAENQGIAEFSPSQLKEATNGVMYWFQETVGDSIDTAIFNVEGDYK